MLVTVLGMFAISPFALYLTRTIMAGVLVRGPRPVRFEAAAYLLGLSYLIAMAILGFRAVNLLTAPEPREAPESEGPDGVSRNRRAQSRTGMIARRCMLITAVAAPGSAVVGAFTYAFFEIDKAASPVIAMLAAAMIFIMVVGGAIALVVSVLAMFVYLRPLAERIPDSGLETWTRLALRGWLADVVAGFVVLALIAVPGAGHTIAALLAVLVVLFALALSVATGLLAMRYWLRFSDLAFAARRRRSSMSPL